MKNWYEYNITELNEAVIEQSGWDDEEQNAVGDAPDTDDADQQSGWDESVENDNGQIDTDYCDDEVDPNAAPQYRTDDCNFKNDPTTEKGVSDIVKDDEGSETVQVESADDVDFDWSEIFN